MGCFCFLFTGGLGIVSGTGSTTFSPEAPMTREQIAVMVYRYLNTLDVKGPEMGEKEPFQDAGQISSYAVEAVNAMQNWGFITGSDGSKFCEYLV